MVDYKIWLIQLIVWGMIALITNIVKFFIQIAFPYTLIKSAEYCLYPLNGHPELEIIVVMLFVPMICNAIILWVQDAFLKGDKHADDRAAAQMKYRRRWEKVHDLRREHADPDAHMKFEDNEGEDEFVLIDESKHKPKPLIRQIEEGVYNIKKEDYDPNGDLSNKRRRSFQAEGDSEDEFADARLEQAHANRSKSQFFRVDDRRELKQNEIAQLMGSSQKKKLQ